MDAREPFGIPGKRQQVVSADVLQADHLHRLVTGGRATGDRIHEPASQKVKPVQEGLADTGVNVIVIKNAGRDVYAGGPAAAGCAR